MCINDIDSEEKHWFLISFAFNGGFCSSLRGEKINKITLPVIEDTQRYAMKNNDNAVCIGVSYLGFMTKKEVENETPITKK